MSKLSEYFRRQKAKSEAKAKRQALLTAYRGVINTEDDVLREAIITTQFDPETAKKYLTEGITKEVTQDYDGSTKEEDASLSDLFDDKEPEELKAIIDKATSAIDLDRQTKMKRERMKDKTVRGTGREKKITSSEAKEKVVKGRSKLAIGGGFAGRGKGGYKPPTISGGGSF